MTCTRGWFLSGQQRHGGGDHVSPLRLWACEVNGEPRGHRLPVMHIASCSTFPLSMHSTSFRRDCHYNDCNACATTGQSLIETPPILGGSMDSAKNGCYAEPPIGDSREESVGQRRIGWQDWTFDCCCTVLSRSTALHPSSNRGVQLP